MSQINYSLENKSVVWSVNSRFRVGETAIHLGVTYVNVTGFNSDPSLLLDWINVSGTTENNPEVTVTSTSNVLTLELKNSYTFRHTLTENTALDLPTDAKDPSCVAMRIKAPIGTSFTITFPSKASGHLVVGHPSHVVTFVEESGSLDGEYLVAGWKSGVDTVWVISALAQ